MLTFGRLVYCVLYMSAFLYKKVSTSELLWPTGDSAGTHETFTNTDTATIGCAVRFANEGPPGLAYNGYEFSGDDEAYIDLYLPSGYLSDIDFSIALLFKPASPFGGTIFHYLAPTATAAQVGDIKVEIIADKLITSVKAGDGADHGSMEAAASTVLTTGWQMMTFSRDAEPNAKWKFFIGDTELYECQTCAPSGLYVAQGVLRIGASQTGIRNAFVGKMACVYIVDSKLDNPSAGITDLVTMCTPPWQSTPASITDPAVFVQAKCSAGTATFDENGVNLQPHSTEPILSTKANISKIKCASLCQEDQNCRSFSFETLPHQCKLYEKATYTTYVSAPGINLYELRDAACCKP